MNRFRRMRNRRLGSRPKPSLSLRRDRQRGGQAHDRLPPRGALISAARLFLSLIIPSSF